MEEVEDRFGFSFITSFTDRWIERSCESQFGKLAKMFGGDKLKG